MLVLEQAQILSNLGLRVSSRSSTTDHQPLWYLLTYLRVAWSNEWTTILYSSPFITRLASPLSLILLELPFIKCREETTSRSMVQVVVKLRYASYNFGHIKLCLWSSRTDWEKNLSFGSHSFFFEKWKKLKNLHTRNAKIFTFF